MRFHRIGWRTQLAHNRGFSRIGYGNQLRFHVLALGPARQPCQSLISDVAYVVCLAQRSVRLTRRQRLRCQYWLSIFTRARLRLHVHHASRLRQPRQLRPQRPPLGSQQYSVGNIYGATLCRCHAGISERAIHPSATQLFRHGMAATRQLGHHDAADLFERTSEWAGWLGDLFFRRARDHSR